MSNPCETIGQCLDALHELDRQMARLKQSRAVVMDDLTTLVLDALAAGKINESVIKLDLRLLHKMRATRQV